MLDNEISEVGVDVDLAQDRADFGDPNEDTNSMEHIQAFVDGCDPEELEYLQHCVGQKIEDQESESTPEEEVTKDVPVKKPQIKKEAVYDIEKDEY